MKKDKNYYFRRIKRYFIHNKKTSLTVSLSIILILFLILSPTVRTTIKNIKNSQFLNSLGIYTEEKKNISFTTDNYNNPGSFKIKEEANWNNSKDTANLIINLETIEKKTNENTKDIILIIDKSESMVGERLDYLKTCTKKFASKIIDDGGKVSIITFSTDSLINTTFTNDKTTINTIIDNLNGSGNTNYYAAYNNLDILMNNYIKEDNKTAVAIFITDGYPNEATPNEQAIYNIIKSKYNYLTINAILYEMGDRIGEKIEKISNNQFKANQKNLDIALENASLEKTNSNYESFEIETFIDKDYFEIVREDIKTNVGSVYLTNDDGYQKVVWNASNLKTGTKVELSLNLRLLDEYKNTEGFYSLLEKMQINYKLEEEKTITNRLTPVLENKKYHVIYHSNTPSNCNSNISVNEEYYSNSYVSKINDNLTCPDYEFKGWKIVEDDVVKLNDNTFIMPNHDVNINAIWTKAEIEKTMEATINPRMNLYDTISYQQTKTNSNIKKYTGNGSNNNEFDVYYYEHGLNNSSKNNVLFAGYCWKIIRTTATGGVKLLYNGVPTSDNSCNSKRVGVLENDTNQVLTLNNNSLYSNSFNYNEELEKYNLESIKSLSEEDILNFNDTLKNKLINSYICLPTQDLTTCSTIAKIKDANLINNNLEITYHNLIKLSSYSVIKDSKYNEDSSLEKVGYMYNNTYPLNHYEENINNQIVFNILEINNQEITFPISENITYTNNTYNQEDIITIDTTNLEEISNTLKDKYFIRNEEANYIVDSYVDNSIIYILYLKLENGQTKEDLNKKIVVGESLTDNNGTYILNNTTTYNLFDWSSLNLENKIICADFSDECTNPLSIISTNKYSYNYIQASKILFGSSFVYDGTNYTLIDTSSHYNTRNISKPYTCFNENGICQTINYMIDYENYYNLSLGKDINNIIEDMLFNNNVNTTSSTIKQLVELWYENNLVIYNDKIEDAVYCNNRTLNDNSFNNNQTLLEFKSKYANSIDLTCSNETDSFKTTNIKAKLNYPIGLITLDEAKLITSSDENNNNNKYWTMTPFDLIKNNNTINVRNTYFTNSNYNGISTDETLGVRPVISLKENTFYSEGNGEENYPFVIE